MGRLSVSTIKSPEFINITSINPLISKCEIKVMYVGENRNRSMITKEVATQMAQSLPGTPIVGYYSENKEDIGDHGEQMIIDGDGIKFNCLTKPYGFVDINTKVWFKEFEDTDEFGNKELREYLMCNGYLWTEQYEEAKKVLEEGRPHSMELDDKTLKGHWSTDNNRGIEFFIINDAIFSKLCILGEDVEPCFEGSSVTSPDVSKDFSLQFNDFTKTLFTMMQELKELTFSLNDKGGNSMEDNQISDLGVENVVDNVTEETSNNGVDENFSNNQDTNEQQINVENQNNTEEFTKDKKEEENKDDSNSDVDNKDGKNDEEEEKKPSSNHELEEKYSLLEQEFAKLEEKVNSLEKEKEELLQFKLNILDKEKDNLINSFYMLSEEDKQEVIQNKSNYTLDEIESKLSVICVRKKVNFNNEGSDAEQNPTTFYNVNATEEANLPSWLQAVVKHRQ